MTKPIPPSKPSFVNKVTWVQKLLAGITGSMFLMSLITMIPFVINLFRPDFLNFLSLLRAVMAGTSLICGCFVGIPQIKGMVSWMIEFYQYYQKFTARQKEIEENEQE